MPKLGLTPDRILEAARAIVARGDYPSLNNLAAELGVTKAAVQHWRGKLAAAGLWEWPIITRGEGVYLRRDRRGTGPAGRADATARPIPQRCPTYEEWLALAGPRIHGPDWRLNRFKRPGP